jgi:hypothetical protein
MFGTDMIANATIQLVTFNTGFRSIGRVTSEAPMLL